MKEPKTFADIAAMEDDFLTCKQIASVLHADPHKIHVQAMQDHTKLGFPVVIYGKRVRIPRKLFLIAMGVNQ